MATIRYIATPSRPGALSNGATVSGAEGDDDWTNNSAVASAQVALPIDVKPGSARNPINPRSLVPVVVFGLEGFDVRTIDPATLAFGPAGAAPVHRRGGHVEDVDRDGLLDLVSHYRARDTGLGRGDVEACVRARTFDGHALRGCDDVWLVPRGR